MITFYDSDDEPSGTLDLVDGELVTTGSADEIIPPPKYRETTNEKLYGYYKSWSNGYSYSKEDSTPTE